MESWEEARLDRVHREVRKGTVVTILEPKGEADEEKNRDVAGSMDPTRVVGFFGKNRGYPVLGTVKAYDALPVFVSAVNDRRSTRHPMSRCKNRRWLIHPANDSR